MRQNILPCISLLSIHFHSEVSVKILVYFGGARVAQLVKHPTLDFGSGHDLTVHEFEPHVKFCTGSAEPAWDSLSPFFLSLSLLALSLKINKL